MADPDPSPSDGAFDDTFDLMASSIDERAQDTIQLSTPADAVKLIDAFRKGPQPPAAGRSFPAGTKVTTSVTLNAKSPWTTLDRATVADSLTTIINNPRLINQSLLNLCGEASFFMVVTGRHPVAIARAATTLFDTGACDIGGLHIQPHADLMTANYAEAAKTATGATQAVWMLLGALRNSKSVFWQPSWRGDPRQNFAGLTRPEEVAGWFTQTGFFAKVVNQGNWVSPAGIPQAEGLQFFKGRDIVLLINAILIGSVDPSFLGKVVLKYFPNHFIVLLNEVVMDVKTNELNFNFWSWGQNFLGQSFTQGLFVPNYYGSITTQLPPQGG